jgi:hypothetical protein
MPDFHKRLAQLSDTVRALQGGEQAARALLQLVADMDAYLEAESNARYMQGMEQFQKWSEFVNASVQEARRFYEQRLPIKRRKLAQAVAGDPRWQGGYADALNLLGEETEAP